MFWIRLESEFSRITGKALKGLKLWGILVHRYASAANRINHFPKSAGIAPGSKAIGIRSEEPPLAMSPPTWMAWARLSSMGRISCCCPETANVRWIASPFAVARTLMSLLIRSSAVLSKAVHCSGISLSSHLRKPDARIAAPWRKGCNSCGSWQRRSNRWVGAHFRWISADQSRIV